MKTYICEICGDAYLGTEKPKNCPFCGAGEGFIKEGKKANMANGSAKANEKPSMPTMGSIHAPVAAFTKIAPTNGPVQEKETRTKVKAIKNAPVYPPLSAFASDLLIIQLGKTISNIPKKEAAKMTKIRKNKTLGSQWVLSQLAKLTPSVTAITVPITV